MRKSKIINNQRKYIKQLINEIELLKGRINTKDELINKLVKAL